MTIKNESQIEIFDCWYLVTGQWNETHVWGLSTGNHPEFMWNIKVHTPIKDPLSELTSDEINKLADDSPEWTGWDKFIHSVEYVEEKLKMSPEMGWMMITAANASGYDQNLHGNRFAIWLVNRVATLLEQMK